MGTKTEEERELERKLSGVMDFYVSTYFEYYTPKIKERVAKYNNTIESDMMNARIDDRVQEVVEEAAIKFHDICMLILDSVMFGKEEEVRQFEILFIDLVKRTLVKEMEESKRRPAPIIIMSKQGVNPQEN